MFSIPNFLSKDDYLQNPVMELFFKEHNISVNLTRSDYIKAIEEYANASKDNENEVIEWMIPTIKEGTKEFCYRKLNTINSAYFNYDFLKIKLSKVYPNCPFKNLLFYKNTNNVELINYEIIVNECHAVDRVNLVFSRLVLEGEKNTEGNLTVYPVFVDIYFNEGFIVSRAKAKSTIYNITESKLLNSSTHIDTKDCAISLIDNIVKLLGFSVESDRNILKNINEQMLYRLYDKFSFTPQEIKEKVEDSKDISREYINRIFDKFKLSNQNKMSAIQDLNIFVEKFISINGNNEEIFKNDRDAYLVKICSDDEMEQTKVDTSSSYDIPLQCTEVFFDNKKSIIKTKKCQRLHLCFKRKDIKCFSKKPYNVQITTKKNFGTFKISTYAEERDIEYVLQTIFEHY